jgi:hypothetical protein
MKCKTLAGILFVALVPGLVGCDNDRPSPVGPGAGSPGPGAITISGTVFDKAFRPLGRATVEVLDGPQAGLSAVADARGGFSMAGAFNEGTRFRATAEGHVPSIRTLQPFCADCHPNWWINFALELPYASAEIGGDYTLTFVANGTCTMLPDDMRTRTFTATIPETSPALRPNEFFRVGGATFFADWDAISIGVAGNYVALWLETVVEQIAPNSFLAFGGEAAGLVETSDMSTIVLPFQGSIEYCVTPAEQGRYTSCLEQRGVSRSCQAGHTLTMTRR